MNLNDASTQLLFTTVQLWVERQDGSQGSATAGIFTLPSVDDPSTGIPMLVTNAHVVKDAKRVVFRFIEADGEKPARGKQVTVEVSGDPLSRHVDHDNDLCVIPFAPVLNRLQSSGKRVFFRSITPSLIPSQEVTEQLSAVEDVVFIGYPSGMSDEHNLLPIVRRGMTATPIWNDFRGKPQFLLDAGVFPGSSGSPVFILNQGSYSNPTGVTIGSRLLFVGVLKDTMVRKDEVSDRVFLGLGIVVRSQCVQALAEQVVANRLATQDARNANS
jgi:hypothetical protein